MQSSSISRNAAMAVIQTIVSGGVFFFLYRYLLGIIGPEKIGIWSIILATVSASRISDLGFTGSAVKFTAKYLERGEHTKACAVITTTVVTIGALMTFVLTISYPIAIWMLPKFIPFAHLQIAFEILPYALVSALIGAIAGVYLSGLEGCQRVDMRAWISMLSLVFFLGLVLVLVPHYSLKGLAWAQIGQGVAMLAGGRVLLKRVLPEYKLMQFWSYSTFREMLRYGANFQLTSIFAMLVEPTTKALMAKYGGLSQTAYYEMANRMILQFRSLLVAANRVVVPQIASLYETRPEQIREKYLESYRLMFFLALPLYAVIASAAPLISCLWIGRYENSFVTYSILICAGNLVNTLVGPAYFINLGTGMLSWNTIAHMTICVLNGVLGYILGMVFTGNGVVVAGVVAIAVGSSLIVFGYHREKQIPFKELVPRESLYLACACCLGFLISWLLSLISLPVSGTASFGLYLISSVIVVLPAFWKHPARVKLMDRLFRVVWRVV